MPEEETGEEQKIEEEKSKGSQDGAWIGLGFWVVVFAFIGYLWFRGETAEVLLNAAAGEKLQVNGKVLYNGAPIDGDVQVTVENAADRRYLRSEMLEVKGGAFQRELAVEGVGPKSSVVVMARFVGKAPGAKEPKEVTGAATAYLNVPQPLGRRTTALILAGVLLPIVVLIVLFTGAMRRRKARVLFSVTYLVTFLSCAIPIVVPGLASRNQYLLDLMEGAPVGLLRGTARGIANPQWLVNIGGVVTKAEKKAEAAKPEAAPAEKKAETPPAETKAAPPVEKKAEPAPEKKAAAPLIAGPDAVWPKVEGGLAVPFYMVVLAIFGAGINMTRQVPVLQKDYDSRVDTEERSLLKEALRAPVAMLSAPDQSIPEAAGIREGLIKAYMYFLSAPFLAIAMYYLLQVVTDNVRESVLVLMGLATGLMSNAVVEAITRFADTMLENLKKKNP